jgi:hypothetical protein
MVEKTNEVIGRGYSAVYYLNSTGHYVIAASVLRLANGEYEPDVRLPQTNWLEDLRCVYLFALQWCVTVVLSCDHNSLI